MRERRETTQTQRPRPGTQARVDGRAGGPVPEGVPVRPRAAGGLQGSSARAGASGAGLPAAVRSVLG
ncbi:hypothetical protein, partial [Streptacidiphilus anmyonensis]|uniref:hypothetical protein n=1 Tax=Streptacidiphilus anmyonensis TaxID=405782 RepID=UPI001F48E5EC